MPFHFHFKTIDHRKEKSSMSNRIREVAAVAAMLAGIPALANAQSLAYSTSPVSVASCSVNEVFPTGTPFDAGTRPLIPGDIALKFSNKSNVPATSVTFLLNDGIYTQTIVDKGTFAPGVQIDHSFAAESAAIAGRNANCSVAEVDFADGSAWRADTRGVAQR